MSIRTVRVFEQRARALRDGYAEAARLLRRASRGLSARPGRSSEAAGVGRMLAQALRVEDLLTRALDACARVRREARRARRLRREARSGAAAAVDPEARRQSLGLYQGAEQLEARVLDLVEGCAALLPYEDFAALACHLQRLEARAEEAARLYPARGGRRRR
jgi:hypothetical protein